MAGTFTPSYNIPLAYGFSFDLDSEYLPEEPLPFHLITSKTGVGTASERSEVWLSFDLPSLTAVEETAHGWLRMPGERAASVFYYGPGEDDNFFRAATESAVEIDAATMASVHGVAASELLLQQSVRHVALHVALQGQIPVCFLWDGRTGARPPRICGLLCVEHDSNRRTTPGDRARN